MESRNIRTILYFLAIDHRFDLETQHQIRVMVIVCLMGLSLWSELQIDYKYSKFLPFTTFWQLLVGALLAFIEFKGKVDDANSKPIPNQD